MKTLFSRSLLTLTIAALGVSLSFMVYILITFNELYNQRSLAVLRDFSCTIQAVLPEGFFRSALETGTVGGGKPAASWFRRLNGIAGLRFTLIDSGGSVVADSSQTGDSPGAEAAAVYSAAPIYGNDGNPIGIFRLSKVVPSMWQRLAPALMPVVLSCLVVIVIAVWGIYRFARSLSRSIDHLIQLTSSVSDAGSIRAENLHAPFISTTVEFKYLDMAIKTMAAELTYRAEQAKNEGRYLEAILNCMSDAVIAMDEHFTLYLVNPLGRRLFNINDSMFLWNLSIYSLTGSKELEAAARQAVTGDVSTELDFVLHASDEIRYFQVFIAPIHKTINDTGTAGGVLIVFKDVTRLVELEKEQKDLVIRNSYELSICFPRRPRKYP
ncbi:hypothetical protein [Breznakiella homolactica]|uniref:Uncharacterized protein n=1 Tax=Breznakiella homolactica TaxID=2798577 RepID=A0A7T8BCB6_9SPIR|nr:hypothetical protein [Breznakiella homolactica]QQO10970.1 hypothetical protein JFL75_08645 [Breznakiella homolactica]